MNNRKHSNRLAWLFRTCCLAATAILPITALADDTDGDGYDDSIDPAIDDPTNYSYTNYTHWYDLALDDADVDFISNFYDSSPWPDSNPWPDMDGDGYVEGGDGISFPVDLAPNDYTNFSSANNYAWYGNVYGDDDGDYSINFYDPYPWDDDNDGISDDFDPLPDNYNNYSYINNISWEFDVLGNADGDALLNWEDPNPYDYDW